jgi:chaperone modulatory protein CbpM
MAPDHGSARTDGGVTMETEQFLAAARLEKGALDAWIEAGWLLPQPDDQADRFSEIDLARAQLIGDLGSLGINEEGIPVILDLVDQLHGLRHVLRVLLAAIRESEATARETSDLDPQERRHP